MRRIGLLLLLATAATLLASPAPYPRTTSVGLRHKATPMRFELGGLAALGGIAVLLQISGNQAGPPRD